jgi:hypothetical protein
VIWLSVPIVHVQDGGAWAAFLMSSAIAAGVSSVADSYRGMAWSASGVTRSSPP